MQRCTEKNFNSQSLFKFCVFFPTPLFCSFKEAFKDYKARFMPKVS